MASFEMEDEEPIARRGDYQPPTAPRLPTSPRGRPAVFEQPDSVPNSFTQNPSTPSSSVPNPPNPSVPTSSGGRPPHTHAIAFESQINTLKRIIRGMEVQITDLKANNHLLQGLVNSQMNESPTPDVEKWEMVKPHMKKISKKLMLGLDVNLSRMFPQEKHMKQEILAVFNVGEGDIYKRSAFERIWEEGMKTKVKTAIINRRGRFASYARLELWQLLDVPKPVNGSQSDIEIWKTSLLPFHTHNNWRWKDEDPFGSDAFFGAIACILSGKNYSSRTPISMLPDQLAWFAYLLGLAMDGDKNMKDSELRFHKAGIKGYKKFILDKRDSINRINVVQEAKTIGNALHDVLGTDLGSSSPSEE